jgi:hypothetical protein
VVLFCASVIGVAVFAVHFLWRGSSRTLFSVQEHRELVNLARSAVSEAYFQLQADLDVSTQKWLDWCTSSRPAKPELFKPDRTRANAQQMSSDPNQLVYTADDVTLERVVGLDAKSDGGKMGIVDFKVTVYVQRSTPAHAAKLSLIERRYFWLADNLGPIRGGGRHVDLAPTPAMTAIERN